MKTLEQVVREHPELTVEGYEAFYTLSPDDSPRARSFRLVREDAIQAAAVWISENVKPQVRFGRRHTSYGIKHRLAPRLGYLSNGELIAAALMAGLKVRRFDSLNVTFNVSDTQWERLTKRVDAEANRRRDRS